MQNQLTLAIQINHQATLAGFFWGENQLLKQELLKTLMHKGEKILYIWGEPGSGKSHLLQGACQAMGLKNQPAAYIPLKEFKSWGPLSIEGVENQSLIGLDDIQSIACVKEWEEALLHLYNKIKDEDKNILLITGDKPPTATKIQLADLSSRLNSSLIFQLHELSKEQKLMALKQYAQKSGFRLPNSSALFLINERKGSNMHELYALIDKLDAASLAAQRKITIPFIKAVLNF